MRYIKHVSEMFLFFHLPLNQASYTKSIMSLYWTLQNLILNFFFNLVDITKIFLEETSKEADIYSVFLLIPFLIGDHHTMITWIAMIHSSLVSF